MYSVKPQLDSSLTINIRLIEEYNVSKVDLLEQSREDALYQAAMIFNMYYSPIVIVIGLIGNSLSLFVMLQVSKSTMSWEFWNIICIEKKTSKGNFLHIADKYVINICLCTYWISWNIYCDFHIVVSWKYKLFFTSMTTKKNCLCIVSDI